ncbi:ATP-binding cassette domain-containing protein, partial [Erysipelatoclostridium ramosum]
ILGPNGAGKSTLMNILSLLLKPTQGEVYLNQADIRKMGSSYLKCIGYMPQINCLYDDFTLQENLLYIASLKG